MHESPQHVVHKRLVSPTDGSEPLQHVKRDRCDRHLWLSGRSMDGWSIASETVVGNGNLDLRDGLWPATTTAERHSALPINYPGGDAVQ